jgi:hypothetical protein
LELDEALLALDGFNLFKHQVVHLRVVRGSLCLNSPFLVVEVDPQIAAVLEVQLEEADGNVRHHEGTLTEAGLAKQVISTLSPSLR